MDILTPIQGWYPDPAGSGQLRFWDGQTWTSSASAVPQAAMANASVGAPLSASAQPYRAADQAYPPAPQYVSPNGYARPGSAAPPWSDRSDRSPQGPRFSKRSKIVLAGVLAAGVALAVAVPTVFSAGKSALTTNFEHSLLTPATVSQITGATFAIDNSKDDNSDDSSTGCIDKASTLTDPGTEKGDASRQFASAPAGGFVSEDLSNNSTNAQQITQLRTALKSCTSATFGGSTVSLALLPSPPVPGSDDVFVMEMSGQINGDPITIDISVARFGDNVVGITYGGLLTPAEAEGTTESAAQSGRCGRPARLAEELAAAKSYSAAGSAPYASSSTCSPQRSSAPPGSACAMAR